MGDGRERRVKFREHADAARAHPKSWVFIEERPTLDSAWSLQHSIVVGRRAAFRPAGAFTARTENRYVWVAFVGEGS